MISPQNINININNNNNNFNNTIYSNSPFEKQDNVEIMQIKLFDYYKKAR